MIMLIFTLFVVCHQRLLEILNETFRQHPPFASFAFDGPVLFYVACLANCILYCLVFFCSQHCNFVSSAACLREKQFFGPNICLDFGHHLSNFLMFFSYTRLRSRRQKRRIFEHRASCKQELAVFSDLTRVVTTKAHVKCEQMLARRFKITSREGRAASSSFNAAAIRSAVENVAAALQVTPRQNNLLLNQVIICIQ